jgi:hypothetical protein
MSAPDAERIGVSPNPLAQTFGQRRRGEQFVAERNRLIKGACLRPQTQGAETVEKRFLGESLRRAALTQAFFNLRGFGKFASGFISARLFARQSTFEDQVGFASLVGLESLAQTRNVESMCFLLVHDFPSQADSESGVYQNFVANAPLRRYNPPRSFRRSIEIKTNRNRKGGSLMKMRN